MASSKRIKQEDIIYAAFEILEEKGIEKVNARDIAKKLNSSVQPIFYRFRNMEDLKSELLKYCLDYYQKYLLDIKSDVSAYKEVGLHYIQFAKEKPNLFKFIFMGDYHIKIEEFSNFDKSYHKVEQVLQSKNNLSDSEVKRLHLKMWMFTHGIACLIATDTCEFSDREISTLLTEQFRAMIKDVCSK